MYNREFKGIGAHDPMMPQAPHFPGKAKSVIYLHMAGAPSQLELLISNQNSSVCTITVSPSLLEGKKFAFIRGTPGCLGRKANFKQHGESRGMDIRLCAHLASIADELAFLGVFQPISLTMVRRNCLCILDQPGWEDPVWVQWVTYGLGTENSNLPGFVVLTSGGKTPDAGKSVWGSGFLPYTRGAVQDTR